MPSTSYSSNQPTLDHLFVSDQACRLRLPVAHLCFEFRRAFGSRWVAIVARLSGPQRFVEPVHWVRAVKLREARRKRSAQLDEAEHPRMRVGFDGLLDESKIGRAHV